MPTPPDPARRPNGRNQFLALAAVGVAVIALGSALPRLVPAPAETEAVSAADPPALGPLLGRLALGMVAVTGLCVVVARLTNRAAAGGPAGGPMEVLAAVPLAGRSRVYLVRAGDRRLLVGVDPAGVKSLVELPGPRPE